MMKIVLLAIAFVLAIVSIQYLKRQGKSHQDELSYLFGDRYRIYKREEKFFVYDRELQMSITINNKTVCFCSREDAVEFMLSYGEMLEWASDEE